MKFGYFRVYPKYCVLTADPFSHQLYAHGQRRSSARSGGVCKQRGPWHKCTTARTTSEISASRTRIRPPIFPKSKPGPEHLSYYPYSLIKLLKKILSKEQCLFWGLYSPRPFSHLNTSKITVSNQKSYDLLFFLLIL